MASVERRGMTGARETETGTLEGFLLARIAEDEQTIRIVSNGRPIVGGVVAEASGDVLSVKRMLAECDAKRRIVEKATRMAERDERYHEIIEPAEYRARYFEKHFGLWLLKVEALPYADHEQFRDEWRV